MLLRIRKWTRQSGGDLLLAAPQQRHVPLAAYRAGTASAASRTLPIEESPPSLPTPPGWELNKDLAALDDQVLLGIIRLLPQASERRMAAFELLVSRYRGLVWSCVRRYAGGPEPAEDLLQVGYVGLLKAIDNFDPAICRSLATYARPCISGEIKRHSVTRAGRSMSSAQ